MAFGKMTQQQETALQLAVMSNRSRVVALLQSFQN